MKTKKNIEYIIYIYNQKLYGIYDGILKFQNPDSMRNEDSEA